ncbi:MAG TPA: DedA family protein [Burkholderiales bacterium]|nr:DedA family protein [Burkholderiales bacterium]
MVFLAGLAAHHGYLSFPAVVAISVIGGSIADQILFFIGRRYGERVFARFPGVAARVPRVRALVQRWDVLAIIVARFLYGLRFAAPIVIGGCGIHPWRLAFLDLLGGVVWAFVVAGLGYFAGEAIQLWASRLNLSSVLFLMALVLIAGTAWNVIRARRR